VLTAALALAGGPVAAQQVEVRVVVPQQTAKEIRAAIEKSIEQAIDVRVLNEISREISDALR
jgi:sugar-specific transcriptional regulator TrmB